MATLTSTYSGTAIDVQQFSTDKMEGAEMGNYLVNGQIIDVREEWPTAVDLKRHSKSVLSDWVMASMPDGQIVKIEDHRPLPADAVDYSVVTPFTYGRQS